MLPSLSLSSSSLDQFRKNVYRPRLCLLLLLVLLSPYNKSQLTTPPSETKVSISQPAQHGWSVSIIDGFVVAAPPAASDLLTTASSTTRSKVPSKGDSDGTSRSNAAGPSPAPLSSSSGGQEHDASESSSTQQGQATPGSLFRFPKLSWGLIVDEHVLPALLPLHVLWAVRLAGMAVEDGIVKNSLLGSKSRFYSVTLPLFYFGVLCSLALLAGQPGTVTVIRSWCQVWRAQLGLPLVDLRATKQSKGSIFRTDGLLPLSLIVMLESGSTVVHLLSILPKLDSSLISWIMPMQLRLPSPSHLPPLVELMPLPRAVKAILTEPVTNPAAARYATRRRPVMPSVGPTVPVRAAMLVRPEHRPGQQTENEDTATASAVRAHSSQANQADQPGDIAPQQVYRRVGAPENEVLQSTSVTQPIAPLQLPENLDAGSAAQNTPTSASRRRRAPRLRGQSVLVSTRWISETATALFDKAIGSLIYAVVTLGLPTLTPTSLPPVLSLLSLRSELASLTQVWTRARSSVECLEFVRRRWGVRLEKGHDPYTSVTRPRAATASGDYKWKSYEDVYCAICFEPTRTADTSNDDTSAHACTDHADKDEAAHHFEFCRLDCGHELHDLCLVSWLTAQAFCPTCHVVLSFSPKAAATAPRRAATQS